MARIPLFKDRKHIRCMFISKINPDSNLADIGLITDDFTFYQCQFRTTAKTITYNLYRKIRKTFKFFKFDSTSDVMYQKHISKIDPIFYYFKSLSENVPFKFKAVNPIYIPKRINLFHPSYLGKYKQSKIHFIDIFLLWDKLVLTGACPWITSEVDLTVKMSYKSYQKRVIFVRLAVYYMLIKLHFYSTTLKSINKKKKSNI